MSAWFAAHRKLVVFIIGGALTIAIQVWGTSNLYVSAAVLAATGLGLYRAPNAPMPAPAAAALPRDPGGRGEATQAVRVVPSAGTAGPAPSGT